MLRSFIHQESKTIASAAMVIAGLSLLSRFVGVIRDRILAGAFGAGDTLDIYYAAFKIPDFLFGLIVVGALSASFIPFFTKYWQAGGKSQAWKMTNNVLHILVLLMVVLSVVLAFFAHPVAAFVAPGFTDQKRILVAEFLRVMLLAQVLFAASAVFGSVLQSVKRFFLYSLAPIFYNGGIMVGALWFSKGDPIGLAWGVVLGASLHLLLQLYGALSAGYRWEWILSWKDPDVRRIVKLATPRVLGIGLSQLNFLILTVMATTLAAGSVTILQFAYNIQFFPVGIIGIAYAVAAFPAFCEALERKDAEQFKTIFSSTVRQMLFFIIPAMILFLVLRAQIVRVIVGAGAFDWAATILTADTLAFFTLSFAAQCLVFILARAFFALHDTLTPLVAGLVATFVGLISALWLSRDYGVAGLGFAYTLSAIINVTLLWVPLRQRVASLDESRIIQSLSVMTSAGLVCGVVAQLLKPITLSFFSLDTFFGVFLQGAFAGMGGLAAYMLMAFVFKSEELQTCIESLERRILRKSKITEPIPQG